MGKMKGYLCLLILIIAAYSLPLKFSLSANPENQKKVALFFDDGWKDQYDKAFPVLKNFGFKATFAVITEYIGLDRGTSKARMNLSELKELQNSGMEIASHTKTHPHMLNLTHKKLIDEIANSKKALTQLGFNVETFVYPSWRMEPDNNRLCEGSRLYLCKNHKARSLHT